MWVRHFAHKRRRPTYRRYALRYAEFHPQDVVAICSWHHEEIHLLYLSIINKHRDRNLVPLRDWTWEQAHALIDELVDFCDRWLKKDTPGVHPVKFALDIAQ